MRREILLLGTFLLGILTFAVTAVADVEGDTVTEDQQSLSAQILDDTATVDQQPSSAQVSDDTIVEEQQSSSQPDSAVAPPPPPPMTAEEFARFHGIDRERRPGLAYMPEDSVRALEHYARGNAHLRNGVLDSAIAEYTAAIDLMPFEGRYRGARGAAFIAAGEFEEAAHDYTDAMFMFPGNSEYRRGRGLAKMNLGDSDGALEDFNSAIRRNPKDAQAYRDRGLLHYNAGREKKALADYKTALRLTPGDAKTRELAKEVRDARKARKKPFPPGPKYILEARGGLHGAIYDYSGWTIGANTGAGGAAFARSKRLNKFGLAAGIDVAGANFYSNATPSRLGTHTIMSVGQHTRPVTRQKVDLSGIGGNPSGIHDTVGTPSQGVDFDNDNFRVSSFTNSIYIAPTYRIGLPKVYLELSAAMHLALAASAHFNAMGGDDYRVKLPVTKIHDYSVNANVRLGALSYSAGWLPDRKAGMAGVSFYLAATNQVDVISAINYNFNRDGSYELMLSLAITRMFW